MNWHIDCKIKPKGEKVFRVNRAKKHNGICLTIEGELKSESVGAAETACLEALANSETVTVVVKNVTEIDADGYAFLKRLAITRARIRAIGIFSQYVLRIIKNGGAARLLLKRETDGHKH
jgi:ABC-type transporter Mla MlaB component